jgi:hypothetical protein
MRIAKTGHVFRIGAADSGQFAGAFHMKLNLAHKVRDRRIIPWNVAPRKNIQLSSNRCSRAAPE